MAGVKLDSHWGLSFYICTFHFVAIKPSLAEIWQFPNLTLKIHSQGYGQGQICWSHLRHKVQSICLYIVSRQSSHFWQRSTRFPTLPWKFKVKVTAKVKFDGQMWGLEFNRYVCVLFHGNRTIFGRDILNFIFYLANSRSRSRPKSNPMVTLEAYSSIDMFAFCFVGIGQFVAEIYRFPYWTLNNSMSRAWRKSTKI